MCSQRLVCVDISFLTYKKKPGSLEKWLILELD